MPPYPTWLRGAAELKTWWLNPVTSCRGSRLVPVAANGSPAFAQYRPTGIDGLLEAFAIQVLTCADAGVSAIDMFVDPALLFDLPVRVSG